ncbi:MAG: ribosome-associated translation inhibitor RaiA [Chloroflexi bacterium]|nr:ribosome-associated translation inhibitor RaiA [Chloroflexota bacterium]
MTTRSGGIGTLKTNLTARNLELSDRLRTQIERKLQRLDRITHEMAEADVELIAKASHANDSAQVAEVTLRNNGDILRSTASGATPMAALDVVLDKLERQVVRTKERPGSVRKRHSDEVESVLQREALGTIDAPEDGQAEDGRPMVVKTKRFDMQPMFEEDAISQMEELGHAFFVFLNAESEEVAVLYRRRDGSYGLIEPVLGNGRGR